MFRPFPLCLPAVALASALLAADPPKKDEPDEDDDRADRLGDGRAAPAPALHAPS